MQTAQNKSFDMIEIRWKDFESKISKAFEDIRSESNFFDVTIGCTDQENRVVEGHKVLLSAVSGFFKDVLLKCCHPKPYIHLSGITYSNLTLIIDFIYTGEVNVQKEQLQSFLQSSKELGIKGLVNEQANRASDRYEPKNGFVFVSPTKTEMIDWNNYDIDKLSSLRAKNRISSKLTNEPVKHSSSALKDVDGVEESFSSYKPLEDIYETQNVESSNDSSGNEYSLENPFMSIEVENVIGNSTGKIEIDRSFDENGIPSSNDSKVPSLRRGRKGEKNPYSEMFEKVKKGGNDTFRCKECRKCFLRWTSAIQHYGILHDTNIETFKCNDCSKTVRSRQMFRIHLYQSHKVKGKNVVMQYGKVLPIKT